jgi:acyl-CoA-dependent ceramide synthase
VREERKFEEILGGEVFATFALTSLRALDTMSTTAVKGRKRSNSVKETLDALEPTRTDHRISPSSTSSSLSSNKQRKVAKLPWEATGRLSWLVSPLKTFQIISATVIAWYLLEHSTTQYSGASNPLARLLFISHPLSPQLGETEQKYGKGIYDLTFLGFYIIVFSFLRQSITEFLIRPLAKKLGLKTESKQARFMEQAYAVVYFSASGAFGLVSLLFLLSYIKRLAD